MSGKHRGSKIPHFDGQSGLAGLIVRGAHQDVRWLEVKMHPATGVKVCNAAGNLECQVGAAWQWQAPPCMKEKTFVKCTTADLVGTLS